MTEIPELDVRSRQRWRTWLRKHHTSSTGVWLVFYKDHTGVNTLSYEDSVREALCFGWIDSLIKRLDDDRYARKFTPRKPSSKWSDSNRKRWTALKTEGLLEPAGIAAVRLALLVICRRAGSIRSRSQTPAGPAASPSGRPRSPGRIARLRVRPGQVGPICGHRRLEP
jgi:hypothetical protein